MIETVITYVLVSILLSLILAFPIIRLLYKYKIVRLIDVDFSSIIESRRLKAGTPIMGGLIIVLTIVIITLSFNLTGNTKVPLIVLMLSAVLGAFDDVLNIYGRERTVYPLKHRLKLIRVHASKLMRIWYFLTFPWYMYKRFFFILGSNPGKGIQAHEKIIVQTIAGAFVSWWIYGQLGWSDVYVPFIGDIHLGILMPVFITFSVVLMANAVNISDGVDGLSSGMLILAFSSLGVIALYHGQQSIALLIGSTIGALITYLYFNTPPARLQMGDVGSLAMGALLATLSFPLKAPIVMFVISGLFIAELGSVVIQGISRRVFGRRFFRMAPLHHHFEMKGWNEYKVVIRFWLIAGILGLFGIWLSFF